ncbi:hypothetical protein BK026_09035 [Alteromonas sp. V450]|uniref:TfuA-like protein n=1 Tax=Alteromonas sp. V450 TaxID=1912139 RepID=UPI0008FF66FC|nr:TfuA-like protein [Alteromonas sp. V450]OJF68925.1 hypothetical protein BK026_09035 [Alteromonas sp. V450]
MSIAIFIGPSLALSDAKKLIDADFYPPAKMGDIIRVLNTQPSAICIIDGYFEHTPAVWHKEILYALSEGVPVFGSSSMGALRAAELDVYGMQGIGKIYHHYTSGKIEDDDEVTVLHASAEDGYFNQSDAMVNIRFGMETAVSLGIVTVEEANALVALQKRRFYHHRSWTSLIDDAKERGLDAKRLAGLIAFINEVKPNQKRDDAIELLKYVAKVKQEGIAPFVPSFDLESTKFWEQTMRQCSGTKGVNGSSIDNQKVVDHYRMTNPRESLVVQQALTMMLVEQEIKLKSFDVIEPREALDAFRKRRNLDSPEQLKDWMVEREVGRDECLELAKIESYIPAISQIGADKFDHFMVLALKERGLFTAVREETNKKLHAATELGLEYSNTDDVATIERALSWYQERYGNINTSLSRRAAECGFQSQENFLEDVCLHYLTSTLVD